MKRRMRVEEEREKKSRRDRLVEEKKGEVQQVEVEERREQLMG